MRDLLDTLHAAGITLRRSAQGTRLLAGPSSALTPACSALIAANKDALLSYLEDPDVAPQLWEEECQHAATMTTTWPEVNGDCAIATMRAIEGGAPAAFVLFGGQEMVEGGER